MSQFSDPWQHAVHVLLAANPALPRIVPIFSFRPLKQPKAQALQIQISITLSSRRFSMQGSLYSQRCFKVLFCLPGLSCFLAELAQRKQHDTDITMISVSMQCAVYSQRFI